MKQNLGNFKTKIETYLQQLPHIDEVISFDQIKEDLIYIFRMGGKRIRPLLCLSVASAIFDQEGDLPWNTACALECFHNFTLVHDDWMDDAPLRRGKTTLHKLRNPSYAILIGDILFAYACLLIAKDPNNHNPVDSLDLLTLTSVKICEGQVRDLEMHENDIALDDYLKMIEMKTATLFATSLKMGYLATGEKNTEILNKLDEFGIYMGIYFQLQDDIMDVFPPSENFGKQIGGDIVNRKKTILYFLFLEQANQHDRDLMEAYWYDKSCPKEPIINLMKQNQIQQYAYQFALQYHQKAVNILESLPSNYHSLHFFLNLVQNRVT